MKKLADYVHSKGLKFGMYTALGNNTCASHNFAVDELGLGCDFGNIPTGCQRAQQDINDLVGFGIDHLKVDGCQGFDVVNMNISYAFVGQFLQVRNFCKTARKFS